ncbi:MAG: N-acetylglutaminylglutamine amidotransferase [Pseudomonadota bacterium]|nr:N-acetylglutaminylglutamine amidotransferase [Pseudomonadota bacterium]
MCGINGEIRWDGTAVNPSVLAVMNQTMEPRGPDEGGVFCAGNRGFGHRRLMIMDLSAHSQQPMFDPSLGLGIVFNGAIYNHPELRQELTAKGYRFYSDGDTEVILKAYHAWGAECLERFKGMFAFAIWERDSGETFLARDRLGIKPLYYSRDRSHFRFASTLPALVAAGGVDTSIDAEALNFYLNFHAVVPAPYTLLKGVRKLPPGHWMRIGEDGHMTEHAYWQLTYTHDAAHQSRSLNEWRDLLLDELRAAVKRRLVAAVDVGVLLSGGVDSSLLVGLMAEAGAERIKTYSVGFEAAGNEAGDEFQYSDIIAQAYGTDHHRIRVASDELLTHLPDAIAAMSEPMVSHDCIGFYLLSREVSKSCRAVQSGQGADEVFGGYHWYPPLVSTTDPFSSYRQAFFDRDFDEYLATVQAAHATPDDAAAAFVRRHFDTPGAHHPVDKALRLDSTVMLVDDPVKRVDNMTMAWGLEARVPFLDHELVEFAARIPPEHKVAGDGKLVLKEAARQVIPAAVIDRPKGYFPVPALKYLSGPILGYVQDALTNDRARQRGLFREDYVARLLAEPHDHITPLRGSKLWQLGLLELWLQNHDL